MIIGSILPSPDKRIEAGIDTLKSHPRNPNNLNLYIDLLLRFSHPIAASDKKEIRFMNAQEAAALYVGLNLFIILVLVFLVIRQRRIHKVVIGDGGHKSLVLAIRAHANAVEIIPLGLIGLVALAGLGSALWIIHVLGIMLTTGRILHAYGLSNSEGTSFGRIAGMMLSLTSLLLMGIACVLGAF
jgi:uncharacterized protein